MSTSVQPVADDPVSAALAKQAQAAIDSGLPQDKVAGRVQQMTAHLNEHPDLRDSAARALSRGVDPNLIFARLAQMSQGRAVEAAPEVRSTAENVTGAIQSAVQGATFGLGNKLEALGETVLPQALGGTKGFDFPQAMQDQTASLQSFRSAHPLTALGLEVAGSVPTALLVGAPAVAKIPGLSAPASSALARIGQTVAKGAIEGGTYGALSSNKPSLSDIAENAGTGAAVGALGGTTLQGVKEGASALGGGLNALRTVGDLTRFAVGGPASKISALARIAQRLGGPEGADLSNLELAEPSTPSGPSTFAPRFEPGEGESSFRSSPSVAKPIPEAAPADPTALSAAQRQQLLDMGIPPEKVAAAKIRPPTSVVQVVKQSPPDIGQNLQKEAADLSTYLDNKFNPPQVDIGSQLAGSLDPKVLATLRARAGLPVSP